MMENEEIIKKIIQSDFEEIQLDDRLTHQIMGRLENPPKKVVQPLVSNGVWIKTGLIIAFIFVVFFIIETNYVLELDLPGITKSIGLFLSELSLPFIGLTAVLILIVLDRLVNKRNLRFR